MNDEEIVEGFRFLGIEESSYPKYSDPDSFASNFKICSLYDDSDVTTSDSITHIDYLTVY